MENNPSLGAHPGRAGVLSHKMDIAVIGLGLEAAAVTRGEGRVGWGQGGAVDGTTNILLSLSVVTAHRTNLSSLIQ